LGARRPILATGGEGGGVIIRDLLNQTEAGIHPPTAEDIKNALKELYREYRLKGEIAYKEEELEIDKYSRREMARRFSELLDHLA